jgi:hypothetical protein
MNVGGFVRKELGKKARKIRWGLSTIPLLSIFDDFYKGTAGYYVIERNIRKESENPLYWIFYFEASFAVKWLRIVITLFRVVFAPLSAAIRKGMTSTLNYLDDEYKPRDEEDILNIPMSIIVKKINLGTAQALDYMLIGRIYYYKSIISWIKGDSKQKREMLLKQSIKYLTYAITIEKDYDKQAEYLYYLAEAYKEAKDKEMQYRSLNLSRRLGFDPAVYELFRLLRKDRVPEARLKPMFKMNGKIKRFKYKFVNDKLITGLYYLIMYIFTNQIKKTTLFIKESGKKNKEVKLSGR